MRPPKARRVVIAVYEGVSLLDLAGPLEAFRVASGFFGSRESRVTYECSVVSIRGGPLKTANGVELVTESVRSLGRDPIDTLIVPGAFAVDDVTRDRALVRWVRDRSPSCRRVCSVCIGSFLLAAAGVLDGRRAATHWLHAALLAERHPRVTVEPDAITTQQPLRIARLSLPKHLEVEVPDLLDAANPFVCLLFLPHQILQPGGGWFLDRPGPGLADSV